MILCKRTHRSRRSFPDDGNYINDQSYYKGPIHQELYIPTRADVYRLKLNSDGRSRGLKLMCYKTQKLWLKVKTFFESRFSFLL